MFWVRRFAIAAVVTAVACMDEPSPQAEQPHFPTGMRAVIATDTTGPSYYVLTPTGWFYHRSCVHTIENGARISVDNVVTRKDGSTYEVPRCPFPVYPVDSGGIEFAYINAASGNWFSRITAQWTVPLAPTRLYGTYQGNYQAYFTFPGIQAPSRFIAQPVLEYGNGTNAWRITAVFCDGPHGLCFRQTPITVSPGDNITGSVSANSCTNGVCSWTIKATDVTTSQVDSLSHSDTVSYYTEALGGAVEVYGLQYCDAYPPNGVFYSGIAVYDNNGTQVTPSWRDSVQSAPNPSCSFSVTSTDTTVNLYHNTDPNPITAVSLGQPYGSGQPCIFAGGPTGGSTPLIYMWGSSDYGTIQVDTTYNTQDTIGWYDYYIPPPANITVSLSVTDAWGSTGSNSDYVAGYVCGSGSAPGKKSPGTKSTSSGGLPGSTPVPGVEAGRKSRRGT